MSNLRQECLICDDSHAHMSKRFGHGIACFVGSVSCGSYCKLSRMISPSGYSGNGYECNRGERSSEISRRRQKGLGTYKIRGGVQASLTPISDSI